MPGMEILIDRINLIHKMNKIKAPAFEPRPLAG